MTSIYEIKLYKKVRLRNNERIYYKHSNGSPIDV